MRRGQRVSGRPTKATQPQNSSSHVQEDHDGHDEKVDLPRRTLLDGRDLVLGEVLELEGGVDAVAPLGHLVVAELSLDVLVVGESLFDLGHGLKRIVW